MKKWCSIIEHNDRQYLFTNLPATHDKPAIIKLSVNMGDFTVDFKLNGNDHVDEFSEEIFNKFVCVETIEKFENQINELEISVKTIN